MAGPTTDGRTLVTGELAHLAPLPDRPDPVDLAHPGSRAALRGRLSRLYTGRPVLVGPGVLASLTPAVELLRAAGATRILAVATGRGAGPLPTGIEVVEVEPVHVVSLTEELRTHDTLVRHLPEAARRRIEAFDPDAEAAWYASPYVTDDEPVLGRPVTMGRPAAFRSLEDKLLAESLWAAVGIRRAPSRVVPAELAHLRTASAELATPLGVVWSGDARDGFNGAGDFVRWVTSPEEEVRAHAFFAPRCDEVRVMPFLDGVPCSLHGVVLPDGTAALRPVELAILRDPRGHRFVFGGLSTYWDAPAADREDMRTVVRRVGEHLRTVHGYRGAFGVDGVLTANGFLPTELNSRLTAGAATVLAGLDPHLLPLLQANLLAGVDPGLGAAELESVLPAADAAPVARVVAVGERSRIDRAETFPVTWEADGLRRAGAPTGSDMVLSPTASGFFATLQPCALVPPGGRMADLNVALTAFLDREYAAGFGPLEPAPEVRT